MNPETMIFLKLSQSTISQSTVNQSPREGLSESEFRIEITRFDMLGFVVGICLGLFLPALCRLAMCVLSGRPVRRIRTAPRRVQINDLSQESGDTIVFDHAVRVHC